MPFCLHADALIGQSLQSWPRPGMMLPLRTQTPIVSAVVGAAAGATIGIGLALLLTMAIWASTWESRAAAGVSDVSSGGRTATALSVPHALKALTVARDGFRPVVLGADSPLLWDNDDVEADDPKGAGSQAEPAEIVKA